MTEFIAGCISGFAQNIIGHPFDTIKVLIQNNKWNKSDIKKTNLFSKKLYKGFIYPTTLSVLLNGLTFQTNNYFNENYSNDKNKLIKNFKNGFYTGLVTSPIVYVFEVGKVKRQVGLDIKFNVFYKTPGLTMTILRESIALSLYLGSYYTLTENNYNPLLSGGIAGLINWTITYPIDVIKNRQMCYDLNIRDSIKIGNLWHGYSICAFRAILVNSLSFYVYELTKQNIKFQLKENHQNNF